MVDDKTQYIDWDKKADIKAQLKVQIILTLAKHKYPPATRDEVFRAIFEQAENFKKNKTSNFDDDTPSIPMVPYYGYEEGTGYSMAAESYDDDK